MIAAKSSQVHAVLYDSVLEVGELAKGGEFLYDANLRIRNKAMRDRGEEDTQTWLGAPSGDELERRLRYGWPEGADKLRQLSAKELDPKSLRRRKEFADEGDEIDMQAVYAGSLDKAWSRTRRHTRTKTRSIAIVCNVSCTSLVTSAQMFWRGASALRLAEALSASGYNVAIYAGAGAVGVDAADKVHLAQIVEVKAEDQPLDLSALAAMVAMPGFKRTRLHAGRAAYCDQIGQLACSGFGTANDNALRNGAALLPLPSTVYVQPQLNDRALAEQWIDAVMAAIAASQE